MILDLIIFLSIAVLFLAVGFARQEERTVKVPLTRSVRVDGEMYHPHSKGREMPVEHALAAGFTKDDFMGEEPEEDEDTGESESEGDSEDDDLLKRNRLRHQALVDAGAEFVEDPGLFVIGDLEIDLAEVNQAEDEVFQNMLEAVKQENAGESESEDNSEGEQSDASKEEAEATALPEDTPEYDKLIKDERFATVEALLENQDSLTDINGIAEKTKQKIVEHVKSNQEG